MPHFLFSQREPIETDPGHIEQHPSIVAATRAATAIGVEIGAAVYIYRVTLDHMILPPSENPMTVIATSSGPDHHKRKDQ